VTAIASAEQAGDVTIVRLTAGENRFNPASLEAIGAVLDEFEAADGPGALVITGEGKFFSNGLDLDWMASAPPDAAAVERAAALAAKPRATVAAIKQAIYGDVVAALQGS
jgi:enoyl-CoA hydratase/carnithine racemase